MIEELITTLTAYKPAHIYHGVITGIKDADTIEVVLDLPFKVKLEVAIRIKDIDTPETYRPRCKGERIFGKAATQFVKDNFLNKKCIIRTSGRSFTRWVGEVIVQTDVTIWTSIRDILIINNHQKSDMRCTSCEVYGVCASKYKDTYPLIHWAIETLN